MKKRRVICFQEGKTKKIIYLRKVFFPNLFSLGLLGWTAFTRHSCFSFSCLGYSIDPHSWLINKTDVRKNIVWCFNHSGYAVRIHEQPFCVWSFCSFLPLSVFLILMTFVGYPLLWKKKKKTWDLAKSCHTTDAFFYILNMGSLWFGCNKILYTLI